MLWRSIAQLGLDGHTSKFLLRRAQAPVGAMQGATTGRLDGAKAAIRRPQNQCRWPFGHSDGQSYFTRRC
jgi:hypothetical protein